MAKGAPRSPQKSSAGNQPPAAARPAAPAHRTVTKPARTAKGSTSPARAPLTSRTTTLDDPLTTSLLAATTRRPRTADLAPEQIAEARARATGDRDPDEST